MLSYDHTMIHGGVIYAILAGFKSVKYLGQPTRIPTYVETYVGVHVSFWEMSHFPKFFPGTGLV